MAMIQIRDVPEEVHETIRERTRACGQSLQDYMHDLMLAHGNSPTTENVWNTVDALRAQNTDTGATTEDLVEDVRALRGE